MASEVVTGSDAETAVAGRITDADVERARAQMGIPAYQRDKPWNRVPDASSISHFAFGIGDDNPLFHDVDYARHTRWRGLIAPPTYLVSTGVDETPKPTDPAAKELFRGLFRGVGKYFSGVRWTWYAPVRPDSPVWCATWTEDVVEKQSSFSGGRSVLETYRTLYVDSSGTPLATRDETYVSAERADRRSPASTTTSSGHAGTRSPWPRSRRPTPRRRGARRTRASSRT